MTSYYSTKVSGETAKVAASLWLFARAGLDLAVRQLEKI